MKTQYYTASSLDGFIATPDHSLEWLFQFDDVEETGYHEFIREVGAMVMGASSYEWLLRHEVMPEGEEIRPWPYTIPTWVFSSRSLPIIHGSDVRLVKGDVGKFHPQMVEAAGGKNLWIVGGGDLAGQFYDQGLLDELIVYVTSVTLGSGKPLLPREIVTPPLRLRSAKTFGEGFVELRYEVPRIEITD
ncbi:MAG: dihydrofolate reductase family protein [Pirellulaceae bacterium]